MVFKLLLQYVQNIWCDNCQDYFQDDHGNYCPKCGQKGGW